MDVTSTNGLAETGGVPLREALDRAVAAVDAIADPIDAVNEVAATFKIIDAGRDQLRTVRIRRIRELRDAGWTGGRLVRATGLSKTRISQLLRAADQL